MATTQAKAEGRESMIPHAAVPLWAHEQEQRERRPRGGGGREAGEGQVTAGPRHPATKLESVPSWFLHQ